MTIKLNFIIILFSAVILYACGSNSTGIQDKKEKLKTLKLEMAEIKSKIDALEQELIAEDSTYANEKDKSILVVAAKIKPTQFSHKISVRGAVASNKNGLISAESMGKVTRINFKEGENVKAGQVLIEMDADILKNSIQELKTSLDLANTLYEKQKKLWDQNIGTEVQYLQAKNQKESLEKRLKTSYSQLDSYIIKAPFDGQVNSLDLKQGEMLSPGMPVCRIVSLEDMYIKSEISEKYVGTFDVGDSVTIELPALGLKIESKIKSIGKVISIQNRTFGIEVDLPKKYSKDVRPNQVAILTLTDYQIENALSVPSKIVQKDEEGNYVYVASKSDIGTVARKKHIEIGSSFKQQTEVISGLKSDENIIVEGYRDVADGSLIKIKS